MLGARVYISQLPAPLSLTTVWGIPLVVSILLLERLRYVKRLAQSTWLAGDKAMMGTQVESPWRSVPLSYCLCRLVWTQVCNWACKALMAASTAVPVHVVAIAAPAGTTTWSPF